MEMRKPFSQAERIDLDGLVGWRAGEGPPLLLVHSVNAAASVAEVRPVFEAMSATRSVFAFDLPGFGASRRDDIDYTPRLMTDAVLAATEEIRRRAGMAPIAALALSLGCEFLARAAAERPGWYSKLALVSPTGFAGPRPQRGPRGSTRELRGLHALLRVPLWSQPLFGALTRPGVVRYFLERSWGGKAIDEAMCAAAVETARAPGARFAPLAFLAGKLFSADIADVYDSLELPVWVSHGTRGDFTDYRGLARLEGRPLWKRMVYEGGALPFFERPEAFSADLRAFLAGPAGRE